jgi:GTP cyclohydrolase I
MDNRARVVSLHEAGKSGVGRRFSAAEHERVLAIGSDVPEERPSFVLPLSEVGISGKTVWVTLPQGTLPFAATLHVDLAAHRRGIHMSRLEEVMTELHPRRFDDLRGYGLALARAMLDCQQAQRGTAVLRGKLPFLREATVSGRTSLDTIEISARVGLERQGTAMREEVAVGATIHHITACPCTQAYNRELFGERAGESPQPTHSQRSCTTLTMAAVGATPGYDELVACLASVLHATQDLLKRPDEAEIVLQSHLHPQFAEDAVREVARAAGRSFGTRLPAEAMVVVESLSQESIHIHDVHCRLATTLGEILAADSGHGHP